MAGAGAAAVGGSPWLSHYQARASLEAAAAEGGEVGTLRDEQQAHRDAWESWGLPVSSLGAGLLLVGLAISVGGSVGVGLGFLLAEEPSQMDGLRE